MKLYVLLVLVLFAIHLIAAMGGAAICLFMTHEPWWHPVAFWGASFAIITSISAGLIAAVDWVLKR
jgi:hypothetical protein